MLQVLLNSTDNKSSHICHEVINQTVFQIISPSLYYKHSGGEFDDFKHLKMHKSVGKRKSVLPYISLCLSSITCGCVQNTATDAAT